MSRLLGAVLVASLIAIAGPGAAAKAPTKKSLVKKESIVDRPPPEAAPMTAFIAAWEDNNPDALSQLFEPEGKLIVPAGTEVGGRDTIRAYYSVAFQSGYFGSKAGARVVRVTKVDNSLALLEGVMSIRGAKLPDGGARRPETRRFSALVRGKPNAYRLVALSETPLTQ